MEISLQSDVNPVRAKHDFKVANKSKVIIIFSLDFQLKTGQSETSQEAQFVGASRHHVRKIQQDIEWIKYGKAIEVV